MLRYLFLLLPAALSGQSHFETLSNGQLSSASTWTPLSGMVFTVNCNQVTNTVTPTTTPAIVASLGITDANCGNVFNSLLRSIPRVAGHHLRSNSRFSQNQS